jgi:hypothetical protein
VAAGEERWRARGEGTVVVREVTVREGRGVAETGSCIFARSSWSLVLARDGPCPRVAFAGGCEGVPRAVELVQCRRELGVFGVC